MPQPPSPSMGIIWPTDGDDADAWAPIMDTAIRVVIDGHNHSAGSGGKVSISQLAFDADISFVDSGGGKHAITDLKAIDFFPSPVAAMAGLAGAFFVSDGTGGLAANELYWRTTTGANVQVTNGATLNSAFFVGGIGGDYSAVGALEIFDDGTDAYWFQQQVGAAVRQFAKMRCSDLSLFEFKAVGATPVPVLAVTLASPAALAAGYTLTFPGALPAAAQVVTVDASGQLASDGVLGANQNMTLSGTGDIKHGDRIIAVHAAAFHAAGNTALGTPQNVANGGTVGTAWSGWAAAPNNTIAAGIPLRVGDRIKSITWFLNKGSNATTMALKVLATTSGGTASSVSTVNENSSGAGDISTTASGINHTLIAGGQLLLTVSTTASLQQFYGCEITYDHP